jgi:hypothetical protein
MTHNLKPTHSVGKHILNVTVDPDTHVDGLEKLMEMAKTASPERRTR